MHHRAVALLVALALLGGCAAASSPASDDPTPPPSSRPSSAIAWPPAMSNPRAVWDPARNMTLVAGDAGGRGIELWGWDGISWQLLDDGRSGAPSARDDIQMVTDPATGSAWLHGGRERGGRALSDTWRWDGRSWVEVVADGADGVPPARVHPVTGWDAAAARLLLQGGIDATDAALPDTWAWDGSGWVRTPATAPTGRWASVAMALDPSTRAMVILAVDLDAAASDGLYTGVLWQRDAAGNWQPAEREGPRFSPIQPMVATRDGLLLVDGGTAQGATTTWRHDTSGWHQADAGGPAPRNGHALAYDQLRDRVVLFGGWDGSGDRNDLWEWDGRAWQHIVGPAGG